MTAIIYYGSCVEGRIWEYLTNVNIIIVEEKIGNKKNRSVDLYLEFFFRCHCYFCKKNAFSFYSGK